MAAFFLDQNVSYASLSELRRHGHDAMHAREVGRARATDDEHLVYVADAGRILPTHDHDFVVLHGIWLRWSAAWGVDARHAGILVVPQQPLMATEDSVSVAQALLASNRVEARCWILNPVRGWVRQ